MVELKKKVVCEKTVGYICDICGNSCAREHDECHEWATLSATWGFYSNKDQELHECHMCESCYDKVRQYIEVLLHGKVRVSNYDLFSGRKLGDDSIKSEDPEEGEC